jgi:hypothetical protein
MSDLTTPDDSEVQVQATTEPGGSVGSGENINGSFALKLVITPRTRAELILAVAVAGSIVGGYFGRLAGYGYYELTPHLVGTINERSVPLVVWTTLRTGSSGIEIRKACERFGLATGIVVGLMAAMLWCREMFRFAKRSQRLIAHGTWVGLAVGVLATLVLHAVFWIALADVSTYLLTLGLVDAFISGPLTGAFCGLLFWIVLRRTTPAEQNRQATSP